MPRPRKRKSKRTKKELIERFNQPLKSIRFTKKAPKD